MNFVSFEFLIFLAATVLVYFIAPKKIRWFVLLVSSYVFYLWSGLDNLGFILFTTVSTFLGGLWLQGIWNRQKKWLAAADEDVTASAKKKYKGKMQVRRRLVMSLILVLNFGVLFFLKYYNFTASVIDTALGAMGLRKAVPEFDLLLPLGISFYTFQTSGYVIDLYRGKYEANKNIAKFALFVSFFPQIIQGPIGRYADLAPQLFDPHKPEYRRCKFGLQLLLWGYFQKIVIADRLMILCINVFDNYMRYEGFELIAASILYGVQLYCDFAGGVNIVRGAAQILGVDMAENFEQPFFATSLSDFWRRWHMSLGQWMKDYVFYPMAMSKPIKKLSKGLGKAFGLTFGSLIPNCIPSLVIFFLIGMWHGASWKYVAFGLYNGGIIALSVLLTPLYNKINDFLHIDTQRFSWRLWQMLRTLFLVTVSRMLVRPDNLKSAVALIKRAFFTFNPWILVDGTLYTMGLPPRDFNLTLVSMGVLLVVGICHEKGIHLRESLDRQGLPLRWLVMLCAILAVLIFGSYGPAFIPTEFIYQVF